eukprot:scaffold8295_cov87-Amphora_coffeaeformis.AAC.1
MEESEAQQVHRELKVLAKKGVPLISGFVHVPEVNIFLPSPIDHVHIHWFDDFIHCVPNKKCVVRVAKRGIYPKPWHESPATYRRVQLPSIDYSGTVDHDNMIKFDFYTIPKRIHMNLSDIRGGNDIPDVFVQCGYVFEPKPGADVSVVFVPKNNRGQPPCLLFAFHNSPKEFGLSDDESIALYKDVIQACVDGDNGGFE